MLNIDSLSVMQIIVDSIVDCRLSGARPRLHLRTSRSLRYSSHVRLVVVVAVVIAVVVAVAVVYTVVYYRLLIPVVVVI